MEQKELIKIKKVVQEVEVGQIPKMLQKILQVQEMLMAGMVEMVELFQEKVKMEFLPAAVEVEREAKIPVIKLGQVTGQMVE